MGAKRVLWFLKHEIVAARWLVACVIRENNGSLRAMFLRLGSMYSAGAFYYLFFLVNIVPASTITVNPRE